MASAFQAINHAAADGATNDELSADRSSAATPSGVGTSAKSRTSSAEPGNALSSAADSNDASLNDNSIYGTRSRNRTGNPRPNYSEDQEYDYDFVSSAATTTTAAAATNTATSKKAQAANSTAVNGTGAPDSKRVKELMSLIGANDTASQANSVSSQATKDASANSKKRKALNAQGATLSSGATSTIGAAASRKSATTASVANPSRDIAMMTFAKSKAHLNKKGELVADDGTRLCVNDHVYLVCEPPGEPYYLCRIMEFLHTDAEDPSSPIDSLRVNWYYRPRDVQRFNSDTRLVYATMHSDFCPITSLRGRCTIKHRSEIGDLELYRKERDSFYFIQVFDRFIRRWYECIPTTSITNVPEKVKKALDERWKFVAIEMSRVKELTSAVKTCKRCSRYCASQDSVDCAICGHSYHMNCVQPPLPKKPSRGFAWACGPCSRASEQKMEARNTPTVSGDVTEAEDEAPEEEEVPEASNDTTRAPSPEAMEIDDHPATQAEIELAKMWPMRYLGIHCRVEDALQYDDRAIYPRASSRLGPRHQATVSAWYGRPVELVKTAESKKKYLKGNAPKDKAKLSKEQLAAMEADRLEKSKRPKWVQDEPPGYITRGEDYPNDDPRCTSKLIFKMPEQAAVDQAEPGNEVKHTDLERKVNNYRKAAEPLARKIGVPPFGVNFLDKMMEIYAASGYNDETALAKLSKVDRVKDMHEPVLSKADLVKFEEGVAKYGSEHRLIRLHMKTSLPHAAIVRFYYLWKKTPKGKEIWGNYPGRKGKKKQDTDTSAKQHEEVAHDVDDSAFDNEKAIANKRAFQCKFCHTTHSRQWRRAPGIAVGQTVLTDARTGNKDKKERLFVGLCIRCANLWRKYAIEWEDIEEVTRKAAAGGAKALKRKIDEELLRELIAANEAASATPEPQTLDGTEPAKKKAKVDAAAASKKSSLVRPPTPEPPPIVPTQPQWKILPCTVCRTGGDTVSCTHCKLTVHRSCYGMPEVDLLLARGAESWTCDQCQNDRNPIVSTDYSCCLCLTEHTDIDLVEPPKAGHKKKNDRDREKERLEKELADAMRAEYTVRQQTLNKPILPREPLKKTTGNNWVHVYCAVWTPEIRFSNAKALEAAEGFQIIPPARHEAVCKLCKNKDHQLKVRSDKGACVSCYQCQAPLHVSCAFEAGYQFGFDVTPVKGSRKDQVTIATIGQETGLIAPAIWCKEHVVKTIIHPMHEIADDTGRTALQVFVESYKQADLSMTGTVRKALLVQNPAKEKAQLALQAAQGGRRESTAHSIAAAVKRGSRTSAMDSKPDESDGRSEHNSTPDNTERRCVKCNIDATPRWHETDKTVYAPRFNAPSYGQRPDQPRVDRTAVYPGSAPNGVLNGNHNVAEPMQIDADVPSREEPSSQLNGETRTRDKDYLCHKCFVKRKLDPTPPPPEPAPRVERSPSLYGHWNGVPPRAGPGPMQHVPLPRSPWEEQTRPSQAPAPPVQPTNMNPYARSPGFASTGLPHSYATGYHQPNGFAGMAAAASPPVPLAPPPPLHDGRQGGHPFHGPPQSRPPTYAQHRPPPQLSAGFLPAAPPLTNGMKSPGSTHHPPMHSPPYPPPPSLPPQHAPYGPRRNESPFSNQLPSLGQPANSNPNPNVTVVRPDSSSMQAPSIHGAPHHHLPPQPHPQSQAHSLPHSLPLSQPLSQPQSLPGPPLSATPATGMMHSQTGPTPPPRDIEGTPKPPSAADSTNASGASASPSVRNLLS